MSGGHLQVVQAGRLDETFVGTKALVTVLGRVIVGGLSDVAQYLEGDPHDLYFVDLAHPAEAPHLRESEAPVALTVLYLGGRQVVLAPEHPVLVPGPRPRSRVGHRACLGAPCPRPIRPHLGGFLMPDQSVPMPVPDRLDGFVERASSLPLSMVLGQAGSCVPATPRGPRSAALASGGTVRPLPRTGTGWLELLGLCPIAPTPSELEHDRARPVHDAPPPVWHLGGLPTPHPIRDLTCGRWHESCDVRWYPDGSMRGYTCTRRSGHTGRHAAGSRSRVIVAVWGVKHVPAAVEQNAAEQPERDVVLEVPA